MIIFKLNLTTLKLSVIFKQAGAVVKICLRLKPNHHQKIQLAQICETFCIIWYLFNSTAFNKKTLKSIDEIAEETLFAVKTCQRFQEERLPFIKETWAKAARHLIYVGDETDESLGLEFFVPFFLFKSFVNLGFRLIFVAQRGKINIFAITSCQK